MLLVVFYLQPTTSSAKPITKESTDTEVINWLKAFRFGNYVKFFSNYTGEFSTCSKCTHASLTVYGHRLAMQYMYVHRLALQYMNTG